MPLFQPDNLDARVLSQFSLSGKTALVTGGSRGIGRQIVTGLAEAGADVAFIYRTATDATQTASEVAKATGVRVQAYQSDVTNKDEITRTIEQIAATFGKGQLDIVIANAGVCQNVPSLEYDEDTWKYMNSVNYDGVMWTALAAGRLFKKQGRGNFIITASVSATLVNVPQTQAAYNASKAGVVQLAKSLAVEWVDFARVNCVSPGYIMTESKSRVPPDILILCPSCPNGFSVDETVEGASGYLGRDDPRKAYLRTPGIKGCKSKFNLCGLTVTHIESSFTFS